MAGVVLYPGRFERFASLVNGGVARAKVRAEMDLSSSQYDKMKRRLIKRSEC